MNRKRVFVASILLLVLVALVVVGVALAANGYKITRHVISSGGGQAKAGHYTLDGTVGQAVVGVNSNSPYELGAGFWYGMSRYRVYLPMVIRSS